MARKPAARNKGSHVNGSKPNRSKTNGTKAHIGKEEHPTGLWVDADVFARLRSGSSDNLKKETFSATQHYLDLAALVLDGKKERKKKSRNKNSGSSAAE